MKLKLGMYSFVKPSQAFLDGGKASVMQTGVALVHFLAEQLGGEFIWGEDILRKPWDILFFNGFALTSESIRDAAAKAVRRAKRIVWIQNDYLVRAPLADGNALSPFRYAFRWREKHGLPRTDHWSTVRQNLDTKGSYYINWNMLTALKKPLRLREPDHLDLFYYGSFRQGRQRSFDQFFGKRHKRLPVVVSSGSPIRNSASRSGQHFQRYPHVTLVPRITDDFYRTLSRHGFGLYIEDGISHRRFHSPANRFFEMLSAGLPIVFEKDSRVMLKEAGFDPKDFVVRGLKDIVALGPERMAIAEEQRERWWRPFKQELADRVQHVFARYTHRYF